MSNNKMICDLETGVCGVAEDEELEIINLHAPEKKLDLYYVTDPICSHCWALEPVLGRFKKQYGHYFNFHTVMGGLLEKWDGFADVSNGIGSPSDVAGHWREVGEYSRMPVDGTVWLEIEFYHLIHLLGSLKSFRSKTSNWLMFFYEE